MMSSPSPSCNHPNFSAMSLSCPDCNAKVSMTTPCDTCGCDYGSHSNGIKGKCNNGCRNCPSFVIPQSCIPSLTVGSTASAMCYHTKMGNALICPDCNVAVHASDACDRCGCEWRYHTQGNSGPCKGGCSGCSHFVFGPKMYSGSTTMTYTAVPVIGKLELRFDEPVVDIKAQRKKDGVCVECGDRGTFISLQCVCTNGHGKIF